MQENASQNCVPSKVNDLDKIKLPSHEGIIREKFSHTVGGKVGGRKVCVTEVLSPGSSRNTCVT